MGYVECTIYVHMYVQKFEILCKTFHIYKDHLVWSLVDDCKTSKISLCILIPTPILVCVKVVKNEKNK